MSPNKLIKFECLQTKSAAEATYDKKCLYLLNRSFFSVPEHKTVEPEMCESNLKIQCGALKIEIYGSVTF